MANTSDFESRAAQISKTIESEVAKIRSSDPLRLPGRDSQIARSYVQKIEGTYNVARAKTDTDNAIDLLYIAYNTTPQEEGEIRVKISAIMDKLIEAQGDSERTMAEAMRTAQNVLSALGNVLPDWLDTKDEKDPAAIKAFVGKDLLDLATDIKARATAIRTKLLVIAGAYGRIIVETTAAAEISEKALGGRLRDQQAILKEIDEAKADRDQIDSLVKDLKEEVEKFEKRARQYEERANSAEQRAFIMQIVKIGAQVVSAALPAIAMAVGAGATGGTSLIAASVLNTASAGAKGDGAAKPDSTAETIRTRTDISQKKKELEAAEKKTAASKEKVTVLRKDLKKAQEAADKPVEADTPKETVEKADDGEEVKGIKGRLKEAKTELDEDQKKSQALIGVLAGLQASLNALAQGLGELSQEQKDEAAGLREIQMKMLDKAEAYEKERREQAAKLVRINALLRGHLSQEETIKLAIKSLNISLSALKRTKEIVEEIAFFFKSFADFMDQVAEEAQLEITLFENVASKPVLGKNRLEQLIQSTDDFFIRQSGEWNAVHAVSDTFNRSFSDGRSKLTRLSGRYITGDELTTYLQGAAVLLKKIADEREDAAKARLIDLEQYRKMLREDATGEGAIVA